MEGSRVLKAKGRPTVPPRADLYDQFWRDIRSIIEEIVDEKSPVVGTVYGKDSVDSSGAPSGKLRLRLDDEDETREVGLSRAKGVRWSTGDRVLAVKNAGGEFVAVAPITSSNSSEAERAVGGNQIDWRSVSMDHIANDVWNAINESATYSYVNKQDDDLWDYINSWIDWIRKNCGCP